MNKKIRAEGILSSKREGRFKKEGSRLEQDRLCVKAEQY